MVRGATALDSPGYQAGLDHDALQPEDKEFRPCFMYRLFGPSGSMINGHWLYFGKWDSGSDPNPKVAAYDLDQQDGRVLAVPGVNERVDELSINDNMAVWVRTLNADQAASTSVIEWTDLQ